MEGFENVSSLIACELRVNCMCGLQLNNGDRGSLMEMHKWVKWDFLQQFCSFMVNTIEVSIFFYLGNKVFQLPHYPVGMWTPASSPDSECWSSNLTAYATVHNQFSKSNEGCD